MQLFFSTGQKQTVAESMPMLDAGMLHCSLAALDNTADLAESWKLLEKKANCSFFLSWSWIGTWLAGLSETPMIFTASIDREPVALGLISNDRAQAPFLLNQSGIPDEDSVYIEFNGLLCDAKINGLEAACWRWLTTAKQPRPLFRRPCFTLNRISVNCYEQVKKGADTTQLISQEAAPFADLAAITATGSDFAASLSRNSRHQLHRAIALYESLEGDLTLLRPGSADEAQRYLDHLIELHQETWQSRGKPGAFSSPFFEDFHRRLIASQFDRGYVDLIAIQTEERAIGYLYNFLYRGQVLSYQSGFHYEEDNRLKPGLVCHALAAQDYLDRGLDRYSFLAGDSRYKRSLSAGAEPLYTVKAMGDSRLSGLLRRILSYR